MKGVSAALCSSEIAIVLERDRVGAFGAVAGQEFPQQEGTDYGLRSRCKFLLETKGV